MIPQQPAIFDDQGVLWMLNSPLQLALELGLNMVE